MGKHSQQSSELIRFRKVVGEVLPQTVMQDHFRISVDWDEWSGGCRYFGVGTYGFGEVVGADCVLERQAESEGVRFNGEDFCPRRVLMTKRGGTCIMRRIPY